MRVVFSEKEIQEILKTLSNENKGILFSKNVFLKLKELIEKYNLSERQKKLFYKIIGLVVIKKISQKEIYTILELNLDIEEKEAIDISNQVNKILELGEVEVKSKRLKELKDKKEKEIQEKEKEEEGEEVVFKKPTRKINLRDSYRETLD